MQEVDKNADVARVKGKKPLTWLATLATLSPRERARPAGSAQFPHSARYSATRSSREGAIEGIYSGTPKPCARFEGTIRECL